MSFVDHLKGTKPEERLLEVAIGLHVIAGDLAKSIRSGSSPTHVVKIQQLLGEAFGKGWSSVRGLWFRGNTRSSSKYTFHRGVTAPAPVLKTFTADSTTDTITCNAHGYNDGDMVIHQPGDLPAPLTAGTVYYVRDKTTNTYKLAATSGGAAIDLTNNGSGTLQVYKNDPTQGVDPVFDQDTPHSQTAWITVECPNGSETEIPDFDTKNNPPTGLSGIYQTQRFDIYNSSGTVTSSDQYGTNPADILAFGCKEIARFDNSRIDWPALITTLKTACNVTETPDYTTLPQGVGLTGSYWSDSAFTLKLSTRVDPVIQFDLSTGAPEIGQSGTDFAVSWQGKIRFKYSETYTMYLTHNDGGKLWINDMNTPIIDQSSAATSSATFAATADQWYDIKMEWTNATGSSEFKLEWQSATQGRKVVPQDRLYPYAGSVKKFATNVAFTQRTSFDDFLRSILFTCNGAFQDTGGQLRFFTLDGLASSFAFNETNIVKNTFNFYPRYSQQELRQLPNRFVADGRDLDSRYLEKFDPPLFYDVAELQDLAGRVIEETVAVGNVIRWQGLKNLAHHAKLKTAGLVCEFDGMPQTLGVLHGDVVTVSHSIPNWTNKQFLCIEATDKSTGRNADERKFKLLEWT